MPSPSLVLLLKAPFEGTLLEKYNYIGLLEHLIEVETNNKVKTLIQLPWVSIYADTENLIQIFGIVIHTQISHPTITKESCYHIENPNRITLGIKLH